MNQKELLDHLKIQKNNASSFISSKNSIGSSNEFLSFSPINGKPLASVATTQFKDYQEVISVSKEAFDTWSKIPAPKRGEVVRQIGDALRLEKENLATLLTTEMGKIYQEALGEVQEMIDICDFAVGLSRQLYGLTMHSERPEHRMYEQYHPLGVVGIISAFNFPVAVWSWNAALALVCGDSIIWKPSEKTPLTALACQKILDRAIERFGAAPEYLSQVVIGDASIGEVLVSSPDVAIVSATGSTAMGRKVGQAVAARFGRSILELGGNNAMIVTPNADLDMAVRAIVFSAVGTCGQRCTSLRRLIVHRDIYNQLIPKLISVYETVKVGNPLDQGTLIGPLIDKLSFDHFEAALHEARADGGKVHGGQRITNGFADESYYIRPALVEMREQSNVVKHETFAPILYVMAYDDLDDAIMMQNDVAQGLSSCIFTTDIREAELFLSASGSDCGIANVNIGPSGAEIGGAFGGEKETGGGRESGSDAWKSYMRRQTNTVNYSKHLPLAQGVTFDI